MDIKTIAKLAGTSVATVSRVINNDARVSEQTKQKVLEVIRQTGYKPNHAGQNLRKKYSNRILMMLPTISNPFYSDIVTAFEETARDNGYGILFAITNREPEIERRYFDMIQTKQVDGVASFIPTLDDHELNEISSTYPFVATCWRGGPNIDASYVCIDNERAAHEMANYLIGLGHSRIAMLNGNYAKRFYERERERGFKRALAEAGFPLRKEHVIYCDYSYLEGYNATARLMALKDPPTAIFAMADERAAGCIKYLNEQGIAVGKDVDVVGFDDVTVSEIVSPEITTVAQPREEIGRESAKLLISKIKDPNQPNKGILMSHKLVIRESTRRPE